MPFPILATKLSFPPLREHLVSRSRLIDRVNSGSRKPLTLISAPAGYGKTTLVSDWHGSSGGQYPAAWLSLDADDNDLERFLVYLSAALEGLGPDIAPVLQSKFQLVQLPFEEELITMLINRVSACPRDFTLVLDDYHVITEPAIHTAMTYLLDHLPVKMHLMVLTRSDPPLPLSRLRANDQMVELRANDLRFTAEEAESFINSVMNLGLSFVNIRTLDQITEGWIAGLQMAGLSLQGREDVPAFIDGFSGSHRYILDYFAEEVLQHQAESIQTFLLKTSILDRLSGSLCDAVLGESNNSAQTLMELERKNLFIIPLDDERNWYRYHHLFSDLLFLRLKQTQPDVIKLLYERAAGWFKQDGDLEKAMGYALRAQNYQLTSQLMIQVKEKLWGYGSVATVMRSIQSLPEELLRSQPEFCISYAAGLTVSGYFDQAEKWLYMVEDYLKSVVVPSLRESTMPAEIALYRSVSTRFRRNYSEAIRLSQYALDQVPNDNIRLRGIALLFLGQAHFYAGNTGTAAGVLLDSVQTNQASGHLAAYLNACHHLAQLKVLQGWLLEANEIYEKAYQVVKEQSHPVYAGIELAGLADIRREWNRLEEARVYSERGLELAEAGDDIFFLRDSYLAGVRVALAQKDWGMAFKYIQKAERVVQRSPTSKDIAYLQAWQARLHLAQGNLVAAEHCMEIKDPDYQTTSDLQHEFESLTFARIWLAQGKLEQALTLLDRVKLGAEKAGRNGQVIEAQMLQALVEQAAGKDKVAIERLSYVLAQAEPEGYVRLFIDEGAPLAKLLYKVSAQASSDKHNYVERLLAAYYQEEAEQEKFTRNRSLIEPLSEREIEVLRLVAAGKANKEIADELVLAVGTVKKHLNTIFGKLDVSSRTQAIARARELELI